MGRRLGKRKAARLAGAICEAAPAPMSSTWTAPEKGQLKLNFDGSTMCKAKSRRSSIGGVYRDDRGRFVLGYAQRVGTQASAIAELTALRRGLELAVENGWRDIAVEGDFKGAVDVMAGRTGFRSRMLLKPYRKVAAILRLLGKTTVSHVLRKGNRVANGFAKLGHEEGMLRLWRDTPPDEVLPHLEEDAPSPVEVLRQLEQGATSPGEVLQHLEQDAPSPDEVLRHLEEDAPSPVEVLRQLE